MTDEGMRCRSPSSSTKVFLCSPAKRMTAHPASTPQDSTTCLQLLPTVTRMEVRMQVLKSGHISYCATSKSHIGDTAAGGVGGRAHMHKWIHSMCPWWQSPFRRGFEASAPCRSGPSAALPPLHCIRWCTSTSFAWPTRGEKRLFRRRNVRRCQQYITVPGRSRWVLEAAVAGHRILGKAGVALPHRHTGKQGEGGADGGPGDATADDALVRLREVSDSQQKVAVR